MLHRGLTFKLRYDNSAVWRKLFELHAVVNHIANDQDREVSFDALLKLKIAYDESDVLPCLVRKFRNKFEVACSFLR